MFPAFSIFNVVQLLIVPNGIIIAASLQQIYDFSSSDEGNEELLSENLEEALELSDDSDCST